jgi:hypothetical protein
VGGMDGASQKPKIIITYQSGPLATHWGSISSDIIHLLFSFLFLSFSAGIAASLFVVGTAYM